MKLFKLIVLFAACKINSLSINEISCPKTEFPKKCLLFGHSSCFVKKNKATKKKRMEYLTVFLLLNFYRTIVILKIKSSIIYNFQ